MYTYCTRLSPSSFNTRNNISALLSNFQRFSLWSTTRAPMFWRFIRALVLTRATAAVVIRSLCVIITCPVSRFDLEHFPITIIIYSNTLPWSSPLFLDFSVHGISGYVISVRFYFGGKFFFFLLTREWRITSCFSYRDNMPLIFFFFVFSLGFFLCKTNNIVLCFSLNSQYTSSWYPPPLSFRATSVNITAYFKITHIVN